MEKKKKSKVIKVVGHKCSTRTGVNAFYASKVRQSWAPMWQPIFNEGIDRVEASSCDCSCDCGCAACDCRTGACPCDDNTPAHAVYWGQEKHFNFQANEKGTVWAFTGVGSKAWNYF